MNGLNLAQPGCRCPHFMIRTDPFLIGTGHDAAVTVDKIDIPADDSLRRIDDLLSQFIGNADLHVPSPSSDTAGQDRATSMAIITVKPRAKDKTPISECSPADISGINSSTTT